MPKNKEPEFTVTDRRRFSDEGDSHPEISSSEEERSQPEAPATKPVANATSAPVEEASPLGEEAPPPPSAQQQQEQHNAFKKSSQQLDDQLKAATGRSAQEFEMSFERFIASLYMTALMQLGLMQEQGGQPPRVDLFGARQTIDTLVILRDKTKGNLSSIEDNLINNSLYELQMAYVEVTNAVNRTVQPASGSGVLPFQKK